MEKVNEMLDEILNTFILVWLNNPTWKNEVIAQMVEKRIKKIKKLSKVVDK